MKFLNRKKQSKENAITVLEDEELQIRESSLNIDYLNEEIIALDSVAEGEQRADRVRFVDKKSIEEKILDMINTMDPEDISFLAQSIRPMVREIIDEECVKLLIPCDNPVIKLPNDDFVIPNTNGQQEISLSSSNMVITDKKCFMQGLKTGELERLSVACIYAANKASVKKQYGSQAAENIHRTIVDKLTKIFGASKVYSSAHDEYAVYGFYESPIEFQNQLNQFQKSIYEINTSNQYVFPIEVNISDANGALFASAEDVFERARKLCLYDEDDDFMDYEEFNTTDQAQQVIEPVIDDRAVSPYRTLEIMDDEDEEDAFYGNILSKELVDFPLVIIKAILTDTYTQKAIDIRLVVNLLDKSSVKQEVLVTGHVGDKDILLTSEYNDEKTTLMIDANYGLILRFGTSVKAFILKEQKNRFVLEQKISKNISNKQPMIFSGMYICPIAKNTNVAAFVYSDSGARRLIRTDESGNLSINGQNYHCSSDGHKFVVGID